MKNLRIMRIHGIISARNACRSGDMREIILFGVFFHAVELLFEAKNVRTRGFACDFPVFTEFRGRDL